MTFSGALFIYFLSLSKRQIHILRDLTVSVIMAVMYLDVFENAHSASA